MILARCHKKSEELSAKKLTGIDKKYGLKWQKNQVEKIKTRLTFKNLPEKSEENQECPGESKTTRLSSLSPRFKKKYPQVQEKLLNVKTKLAKKTETAKNTASLITSDIKEELPHIKNKANSLKRNLSHKKLATEEEPNLGDTAADKKPSVFDDRVSTLKRNMSQKGQAIKDASSEWNSTLTKNVLEKKQAIKEATVDWKERSLAIVQRKKPEQGP